MRPDMAKFEIDDDVLDSVSGGAAQEEIVNCGAINKINEDGGSKCSNCRNYRGGKCINPSGVLYQG